MELNPETDLEIDTNDLTAELKNFRLCFTVIINIRPK